MELTIRDRLAALARLRHRNNPVAFAVEILGFEPDANQAAVLSVETRRGILACHRQWGKSTTAAVKAIHHAFHHADSLTVVVAPTLRQGGLLLKSIQRFARKLGLRVKPDGLNRPSLVLPNGATVVAVPSDEDNIRGFAAVSLLLIDEAARVPDEVWASVLPMVSTVDGAVWLMSTPKGKQGFFADTWFSGDDSWHRVCANIETSTRIPKSVIEDQRRGLTRAQFAQDYLCEFGDIEDQVFRSDDIQAAFSKSFDPLPAGPNKRPCFIGRNVAELNYFVGLDLGQRRDFTAIAILELESRFNGLRDALTFTHLTDTTLRLRWLERLPLGTSYPDVMNHVTDLVQQLGQQTVVVADATGLGAPFVDFLRKSNLRLRDDYPNRPPRQIPAMADRFTPHGYILPVTITSGGHAGPGPRGGFHVPKVDLIETLERMFESRRLEISAQLASAMTLKAELLGLRRNGSQYEPHSDRLHDDMVMALALAAWRASRQKSSLLDPAPVICARPA